MTHLFCLWSCFYWISVCSDPSGSSCSPRSVFQGIPAAESGSRKHLSRLWFPPQTSVKCFHVSQAELVLGGVGRVEASEDDLNHVMLKVQPSHVTMNWAWKCSTSCWDRETRRRVQRVLIPQNQNWRFKLQDIFCFVHVDTDGVLTGSACVGGITLKTSRKQNQFNYVWWFWWFWWSRVTSVWFSSNSVYKLKPDNDSSLFKQWLKL